MNMEIKIEHWEADEYVLLFAGKVQGHTLNKRDAEMIKDYLKSIDFNDIARFLLGPKGIH